MKTILSLLLLTLHSYAGFTLPKNAFTCDQIEAAKKEAQKEKKALAFLYSDPKSTCPLCDAASEEAMRKLHSHSVVVLVNTNLSSDWNYVNPVVMSGLNDPKMGNIIPKVVITSQDMNALIAQMSNQDMKSSSTYSTAKKEVEAMLSKKTPPTTDLARITHWKSSKGTGYYIGTYEGMVNDSVVKLKMGSGGNVSNLKLDQFNSSTIAFIKGIAQNENTASKAEDFKIEDWTGANGTTIQAKFVSLVDNKVTLEMNGGKSHTLTLDRLDQKSQEKAKSYGIEKP